MSEARAVYQRSAADWRVDELASHSFSESGEHAWFYIEKTNLNTLDVVDELVDACGVAKVDVGYAGRKDRVGVTRQWFSVRTPGDAWPNIHGTRCLATHRHVKKLRIGVLDGNRFEIVLRDVCGWKESLGAELANGGPNVFGPQRFSGDNLERARHWLNHRPRGRRQQSTRGWHLSVLRSFLFNEVIRQRQACEALPQFVSGDLALGGYPSAPLWGRGRSRSRGRAAEIEALALEPHAELCDGLEHAGVTQMRRAMYVRPKRFSVEAGDGTLVLRFDLPAGAYATALLGHVFDLTREGCDEGRDGD